MSKSLRQHAGPAGDRRQERRRHLAPVGGKLRLHRRSAHRPGHHQGQCRCLSPPAQHHPLHAGQSRRASTKRERIAPAEMPELERYMLARLAELDATVRDGYDGYDFNRVFTALFNFCTNDLSAFYFDIRKDALYCDAAAVRAPPRRAHRDRRNLPPRRRPGSRRSSASPWKKPGPRASGEDDSVHLQSLRRNARRLGRCRADREMEAHPRACAASSPARSKSRAATRSSAPASKPRPTLYVEDAEDAALFDGVDLAEIAITSDARGRRCDAAARGAFRLPDVPGAAVIFQPAEGDKCARCWMILPEVGTMPEAAGSVPPLRRGGGRHAAGMSAAAAPCRRAIWGLVSAAAALFLDQAHKLLLLYGFGFIHMAPGEACRSCRSLIS